MAGKQQPKMSQLVIDVQESITEMDQHWQLVLSQIALIEQKGDTNYDAMQSIKKLARWIHKHKVAGLNALSELSYQLTLGCPGSGDVDTTITPVITPLATTD